MTSTEQRLAKLERTVSRWRIIAACLVLLAIGVGANANLKKRGEFDLIETKWLSIVDEAGSTHSAFHTLDNGSALTLSHGLRAIGLNISKNGAEVGIKNLHNQHGISLVMDDNGPSLRVTDQDGKLLHEWP